MHRAFRNSVRLVRAESGVVVHLARHDEIIGAVGNDQDRRGLLYSVRVFTDMLEVGQHIVVVRIPVDAQNIVFCLQIGAVGPGGFGPESLSG